VKMRKPGQCGMGDSWKMKAYVRVRLVIYI
jgi:hypothetical protein